MLLPGSHPPTWLCFESDRGNMVDRRATKGPQTLQWCSRCPGVAADGLVVCRVCRKQQLRSLRQLSHCQRVAESRHSPPCYCPPQLPASTRTPSISWVQICCVTTKSEHAIALSTLLGCSTAHFRLNQSQPHRLQAASQRQKCSHQDILASLRKVGGGETCQLSLSIQVFVNQKSEDMFHQALTFRTIMFGIKLTVKAACWGKVISDCSRRDTSTSFYVLTHSCCRSLTHRVIFRHPLGG